MPRPITLTKADIVASLAKTGLLERPQARLLTDYFFEFIKESLEKGDTVKLSKLGNFIVREKKARPGRNPKTGEDAIISARRVVTFHAGDKLKAQIANLTPPESAS